MKLLYKQLKKKDSLERVIFHSLSPSLYQVSVAVDGQECLLWEDDKTPIRSNNLPDLRRKMAGFTMQEQVLRQERDYEEMIGQPPEASEATLEIPLAEHTDG